MMRLEKKGYRIVIENWVGNLGNHLIQVSSALNVAEKTESRLTIPKHPLLKRRVFDFTNRANENCAEPIVGRFFYQADCFQFPIIFDSERREIFRKYVYDLLVGRTVRERVAELVSPRQNEAVNSDTLVINMRSGRDIFRSEPPPQNDYMQPPLSFYKHVIEAHRYRDCLIVTEADRKNPCIDALMSWNRSIRIKTHTTVSDDVRTILSATSLVMCHSTFSWCLALMSKNLKNLYQPSTFQIVSVDDLSIDTYQFNGFVKPGEWTATEDQLALMVNHSTKDVHVTHCPPVTAGTQRLRRPSRHV
jgi:hypothetical protein